MSTSPGQADPLIGRRFGSYVVSRKLGEGGMGAVYELVHPQIGKKQALKVLHAEYAKKTSIVERFFAEAKSVVMIGHPNIVDITDYATLDDGTAYIVMEFLEGQSLAGYVKQRGPMSPAEMAAVVLPICDALGAAHAHGIVHRDLKPENVHLVPRPDNPRYVKVLDFGIAKLATPDGSAAGPMTKTGQVMGTPTYMSPEQAMGRTREIDHRTDVYALGILMYQLLSGELPFQADSFGDLMLMHLSQPPPRLATRRPDLPPVWDAIIQRALAKNRDERFGSMREIADAIRAGLGQAFPALAGAPTGAPMVATVAMPAAASYPSVPMAATTLPSGPSWPPPSGESTPVPAAATAAKPRRSPALAIALGLIAVATAVAVVVIVSAGKKSEPSASPPVAAITPDAGVAPVAAVTPDAAAIPDAAGEAVALSSPDAAPPAVAVVTPDAAPEPPPGKNDHHHHHQDPTPVLSPTGPPHQPMTGPVHAPTGPPEAGARAKLRITALPWGNVIVDGRTYGQTPQIVDVPAGKPIKVRVTNPELGADQTQTVVGDPDGVKLVRFNFGAAE